MKRAFAARVLTTPNLDDTAPIQKVTQDEIINDQANNNDGDAEQQPEQKDSQQSSLPSTISIIETNYATISIDNHMNWLRDNDPDAYRILNTMLITRNTNHVTPITTDQLPKDSQDLL